MDNQNKSENNSQKLKNNENKQNKNNKIQEILKKMNEAQKELINKKKDNIIRNNDMQNEVKKNIGNIDKKQLLTKMENEQNKLTKEKRKSIENTDSMILNNNKNGIRNQKKYMKNMNDAQNSLVNEKKNNYEVNDNMKTNNSIGNMNSDEYIKNMKDSQNKLITQKKNNIEANDTMKIDNKNKRGNINYEEHINKMKNTQNELVDKRRSIIEIDDNMKNENKNNIRMINKEEYIKNMNDKQDKLMRDKKNSIKINDDMQKIINGDIGIINQEERLKKMNNEQNKIIDEKKNNIEINDNMQNVKKDNIRIINQEEHMKNMNELQDKLLNDKKKVIKINDNMQDINNGDICLIDKEKHIKKMNEEQNKILDEKKNIIQTTDNMQNIDKNNIKIINQKEHMKNMNDLQDIIENNKKNIIKSNDNMQNANNSNICLINQEERLKKMNDEQKKILEEKKNIIEITDNMQNANKENISTINQEERLKKMNDEQNKILDEKRNNIEINDNMKIENKDNIRIINQEEHMKIMNDTQDKLIDYKKNSIKIHDDMQNIKNCDIGVINQEEVLKKMNDEQNKILEEKKNNIEITDNMQNIDKNNIGIINQEEHFKKMNDEQIKLLDEKRNNIEANDEMRANLDEIINDQERKEKTNNFINDININIEKERLESEPIQEEEKILVEVLGTETILESKEKFTIYKYPDFQFSPEVNNNCKVILMIGNAQTYFINTFITMYSNIQYDDNFRYSICTTPNNEISVYNIRSRTHEKHYDIKIVTIPIIEQINDEFKNNMINLFNEVIPQKKIHIICFTYEENEEKLNVYEKIFYKFIINLLDYKVKLFFLISSSQTNSDINNKNYLINKFFNFEKNEIENLDISYFSLNNKIIFECDENNWNKIKEKMDIIKNEISNSKRVVLTEDKINIMKAIFFEEKEKLAQKFINFQMNEKFIILYYLMDLNNYLGENLSILILSLFNCIIKNEYDNSFNINTNKLEFIYEPNYRKYIHILSNLSLNFSILEIIKIIHCENEDNNNISYTMPLFEKITSNKIKILNLNNNKFRDVTWLSELNMFSNLKTLDLSFNNIENLSPLMDSKFNNLESLNLCHNKISSLDYFKYNYFPSLKYLNLSENELKSGIDIFSSAFKNTSKKLILELKSQQNNELFFNYSENLEIEYKYIIEDNSFDDILKNISFEGIKHLKLKNFDNNIHFLESSTLKSLKILDIIDMNINNDLSLFNNIKFINLKNIYAIKESDIIEESKYLYVKEGFKYLNFFSLIYVDELKIEKNIQSQCYNCYANFRDPKLNVFFTNTDFLYYDFLSNVKNLIISSDLFDIDGNSSNIFSYQTLKYHKLPFLKKIYSDKISINYIKEKNIYETNINFLNPSINLTFNFNDLSFINDSDILYNTEKIILNKIPNDELKIVLFEKFISSLDIILNNIYIENIEIIDRIYPLNFRTFNVLLSPDLIEPMEKFDLKKMINDSKIKYFYPKIIENNSDFPEMYEDILNEKKQFFCFEIKLNQKILKTIKTLKNCLSLDIAFMQADENDLSFLAHDYSSTIIYMNLSNNKIKNINFITYNSLANLKRLDLSYNKIDDISLLSNENNKCKNLTLLRIKENPIKKGLEVMKQNFFLNNSAYITLNNITKKNDEFFVSLTFENSLQFIDLKIKNNDIKKLLDYNPNINEKEKGECKYIYIDFYIKDLNNLWNIIDYEYTFFGLNLTYKELKNDFNLDISEKEFSIKKQIQSYIELLDSNRRNFIYSLYIGNEDDEIILKLFKLLYKRGYNYIIELSELDFYLCYYKVKHYFSFIYSNSLNNHDFKGLSNLNTIDLSKIKLNNISSLCGDVPFTNIRTLKLCNNHNILNLYELKNAKFINLENLDLSDDGIHDLKEIEIEKYPFLELTSLNLGYNSLEKIEPILHFTKLTNVNLEYNNLSTHTTLIILEGSKIFINAELRGNKP